MLYLLIHNNNIKPNTNPTQTTNNKPTIKSHGNSADKLCHPRSVAYSVELVLLNKHKISVVELVCTVTKVTLGDDITAQVF